MNRLKEPSTWAGIAGILATIVNFLPPNIGLIIGGIATASGSIAVYLREHSNA
jgi:hypothetical protein